MPSVLTCPLRDKDLAMACLQEREYPGLLIGRFYIELLGIYTILTLLSTYSSPNGLLPLAAIYRTRRYSYLW